ncbi:hypothetical protein KVR01_005806 [Diaporthe batatas]|uniref:uncharacterized protein n=1 Tax=Diaporthe batatas TaxID=748121 RepID=UPI001D03A0D3|nr:uncharacterized protein KVR01_005806 [Diaporthe batatas]KAG8163888.1 hypothetical protein KVR01_005806 [Diaporthe batatas]
MSPYFGRSSFFGLLLSRAPLLTALRFDERYADFNLNQNATASDPLDYWGAWPDHEYHPSPENWRFPFYSLYLDRFVNGNPFNDDVNNTVYETDPTSTTMRYGGDILGLVDSLDYIHGMGIRGVYLAGSALINQPWAAHSYSPIDLTMLDPHFGTINDWRQAVVEIHKRGMYVVFDNTFNTLGDLLEFTNTPNSSTKFSPRELEVGYKTESRYLDFSLSDKYHDKCPWKLPQFWGEDGFPVSRGQLDIDEGCYESEFDQFGNSGAFDDGIEVYQRQLTKFSSAQDRLREWNPTVLRKILHFSCLVISMLDIDGYRIDKAIQVAVEAQAEFSRYMRECARRHGKENFFIAGEIVSQKGLSSVYFGRGRQPDMVPQDTATALYRVLSKDDYSDNIRSLEYSAIDGAAFHYGLYRALVVFLGMDGSLSLPSGSRQLNFHDMWQEYLKTDDMINANTGVFDPRHMWGVSNQDVFRWSSIERGREKMLLGLFITTFLFPGIPLLSWGDEQTLYILDNTADDYMFGRQSMGASMAWQMHGCHSQGSKQYYQMALGPARNGCHDDGVSLDHRDPSHPIRNIVKIMNARRDQYPVLRDGWFMEQLSNRTRHYAFPGSDGMPTELGIWSTLRDAFAPFQNLSGPGGGHEQVLLVYHNEEFQANYEQGCTGRNSSMIMSPFAPGTRLKNLLFPYDELETEDFPHNESSGASGNAQSCLEHVELLPYGFKVYVRVDAWKPPPPVITRFLPGHDARLLSKAAPGLPESIDISFSFSQAMNCSSITENIDIQSQNDHADITPNLRPHSVECSWEMGNEDMKFNGQPSTRYTWKATLENVYPGVHAVTVGNASSDGQEFTNSNDRFLFRIGAQNNPMVFPRQSMYPTHIIRRQSHGRGLQAHLDAPGAQLWRYSLTWGASWSEWKPYSGGEHALVEHPWTGTRTQEWTGEHIMIQYWSQLTGSSAVMQHGDLDGPDDGPRLFPHLFAHGKFNEYGHDTSLTSEIKFEGQWKYHFMGEWPDGFAVNVWGINPDGQQDLSFVYGDLDQDGVLDRWIPSTLSEVKIRLDHPPPYPHLAYEFLLERDSYRYTLRPTGNRWYQVILALIFSIILPSCGLIGVWLYQSLFCRVIVNRKGSPRRRESGVPPQHGRQIALEPRPISNARRRVLFATIEYEIPDWNIDIRLGGLGTIAMLMGRYLDNYDLVWVVPCVADVDYPFSGASDPMVVSVCGQKVQVEVYYHTRKNITYMLLDAEIFRRQTKAQPYPTRMDDMDSAIFYSVWNACIAQAIRRVSADIYHINDYHGALAPIHLLPEPDVACVLSLHNAEYQGLWPIRTPEEEAEISAVFDVDTRTMKRYVQFGTVFNILHAAANYIRIHQKGVGVVGVSEKYSQTCLVRYPVLWGLGRVGSLPNPDPTQVSHNTELEVDQLEDRAELKSKTQKWACLHDDPFAEVFVFVGRMSKQKGIDLIADVFPSILEQNRHTQLICVGPVVDLYGKFAAAKLRRVAEIFPGRVCCKPEFTKLPSFIFGGGDFVLIPSRDEPYGLVAVQFGRRGTLAVGSRVGGLGNVPGWWYTIESTETLHLLSQFKKSLHMALESGQLERDRMRAASMIQSFPISEWKDKLEELYASVMVSRQSRENPGNTRLLHMQSVEPGKIIRHSYPQGFLENFRRIVGQIGSLIPCYQRQNSRDENYGFTRLEDGVSFGDAFGVDIETLQGDNYNTKHLLPQHTKIDDNHEYSRLGNPEPTFTDQSGEFYAHYSDMLGGLTADNSEIQLCVQDYLVRSERQWFEKVRDARFGLSPSTSRHQGLGSLSRKEDDGYQVLDTRRSFDVELRDEEIEVYRRESYNVSGLQRRMSAKIFGTPGYTYLLILGQIMSANPSQIGIIAGSITQTERQLYHTGSIYAITSIIWWVLYRRLKLVHVVSFPFLLFGSSYFVLSLILLGGRQKTSVEWPLELVQTLYVCGSSTASLYFAMNFIEEESSPVSSWITRAGYISGLQYGYQALFWYGGNRIRENIASAGHPIRTASPQWMSLVALLAAACLGWVYYALLHGLPRPYDQKPGSTPTFYRSLFRRPVPLHFLLSTFIQSYLLSAPLVSRSWLFLFSSPHLPGYMITLLVAISIAAFLCLTRKMAVRSLSHGQWILPIFSFASSSIINPRWAQLWWVISRTGLSIPWAQLPRFGGEGIMVMMQYSPGLSAALSRSLWLYLGVLDLLVGLGQGLALIQTLPRQHVLFVSTAGQVIGAVGMMAARATILSQSGGPAEAARGLKVLAHIFPDISSGLALEWGYGIFCLVAVVEIIMAVQWMWWFRSAQLQKP